MVTISYVELIILEGLLIIIIIFTFFHRHSNSIVAHGARQYNLYINLRRSRDCRLIWLSVGMCGCGFYSQLPASFTYYGQLIHCT